MRPLQRLLDAFRARGESLVEAAPDIVTALIVLVAFVWLGRIAAGVLDRMLARGRLSATHRRFFRGLTAWMVALLGLALALSVLGLSGLAAGLVTSGGVTAIVLGFAFRGIGENLLAGFFLAFSRPFDLGDYIASEELEGTVRGIELRSTHIRTRDGRDIYIPSAQLFNSSLTNFTRDHLLRPSFRIGVDYRTDLAGARQLLVATLEDLDAVLEDPAPTVAAVATAASTVDIEVAFWVDTTRHTTVQAKGAAIEACVKALGEAGVTFSSEVSTTVELIRTGGRPQETEAGGTTGAGAS